MEDTLLKDQSEEVNFTTCADIAITTPSVALSQKLISKWDPPSGLATVFVDFIRHAQCLSNHFPKASLRTVCNNIVTNSRSYHFSDLVQHKPTFIESKELYSSTRIPVSQSTVGCIQRNTFTKAC